MWTYTIKDYIVDQTNELHYTCTLSHPDGRSEDFSGSCNDPENIRSVMADLIAKKNQIDDLKTKMDVFVAANLKGQKLPDPEPVEPTKEYIESQTLISLELIKRKVDIGLVDQSVLDDALIDAKRAVDETTQVADVRTNV